MTEAPVVEIKDMSYSYGAVPALKDVNFVAGQNELICIVGPNGGGKTTLLKVIVGLLRPDSGEVRVFGRPPTRVRDRIGYMPQNPRHDLSFPVNVLEVVLMGRLERRLFGPYTGADREAARRALGEVDMDGFARRPFSDLSGGQRQRVLIARALSSDPQLLVLDEPTANIDPGQERHLHEILQRLKKRITILMVTHDFVSDTVEEVVCVNRGIEEHPTSLIEGHTAAELYAGHGRVVRHDRNVFPAKGDSKNGY